MAYPVVLIHGMSCTGANWNRVVGLMTPRGCNCLAPSLPAHDSSPDQRRRVGRQGLRNYLAFLEQIVATREDRRPPIIIGHSMGGLLAQRLCHGDSGLRPRRRFGSQGDEKNSYKGYRFPPEIIQQIP
jgi:pimeloyl-ACP methyl ester carboxylesterase